MKKILIIGLLLAQGGFAQTSLKLDTCIVWAKKHYPLIRQNEVTRKMSETNIQSINENWLPKLSFGAQAIYQTEVVQFNIPGFNTKFPHDQYVANVSLEQTIFDGGQTKTRKDIEYLSTEMEVQRNEVELYKLADRVNQLYVSILLTRENLNVLDIFQKDLKNRRNNVESAKNNGLALSSSLDELDAELLKTEQNITESKDNLSALYKSLSYYIDQPVNDATVLEIIPIGGIAKHTEVVRPELKLFSIQEEMLASQNKLTNRYALPKLTVGVAGNYGRPGPNFINQNLRFFGSANVSLKWNISSLYGLKREKNRYEFQQTQVEIQKGVFLFNLENALLTQEAQINTMKTVITKDEEIISKRHNVTTTAASQLENGKITVTDYIQQLNAELNAKLNQKIHEIKLMNAMSNYNTTKGITNF